MNEKKVIKERRNQIVIDNVHILYSYESFEFGTEILMECLTHKTLIKVNDLIIGPGDPVIVEHLKLFAEQVRYERDRK